MHVPPQRNPFTPKNGIITAKFVAKQEKINILLYREQMLKLEYQPKTGKNMVSTTTMDR